jgi:hypothetical protein
MRNEDRIAQRAAVLSGVAFLVFIFAMAAAIGGCRTFSPEDVQLIRTGIAVNEAHVNDVRLPAEARAIARDAADAFHVLRFSADGTPVPAEVEARITDD